MFGDQSSSSPYVTPSSTAAFGPPSSTPALGTPQSTPAMGTPSGNSAFRPPSSTSGFGPPSWNPGFGPPSWNPGFGPSSWNPAFRPPSSTPDLGTPSWNPAFGPPSWNPAFGRPSWNPSFVTPWTPAFVTPSTFQQQTPLFNFQQPHSPGAFEFEFESYMPWLEEQTPFPDFDMMTEIDHVSLPCRNIPFSLPNRDIQSTKDSISNLTDVSLKITKHLLTTEGKDKNMVYSPLSIQIVLWLLTAGSKGPTKEQLLSFLKSKSVDELNSLATHLVPLVFADGSPIGGPCLSFANGLWVKESLSIKPSFKEVVDTSYKADINHVSFLNPEKVRLEVNLWAEKATKGLITEALPPGMVNKKTILIFSNALYFKGLWSNKFNASNTKEEFFRLLNGHYVKAQFMGSYEAPQFVEAFDGFKVAKLPYKQGEDKERQFSMYFFLPHKRNGLPALVERVCSEPGFLDRHRPARQVLVGTFKIPRFKITSGFKASDILQELGLVLPFTDGLTEMVESDIPQGKIFHKSFIEVEEEGTKAAAVSTFFGESGSAGPIAPIKKIDFVADHPFLFLIREERTGTVMFIGQVLNPLKE